MEADAPEHLSVIAPGHAAYLKR